MFLDEIESLYQWKSENLPGADTPPGAEVLGWLLRNFSGGGALKDLYRQSQFSEPTVRARINDLVGKGLIEIKLDAEDSRRHIVCPTPKLESVLIEYLARICSVASASGPAPTPPDGHCS